MQACTSDPPPDLAHVVLVRTSDAFDCRQSSHEACMRMSLFKKLTRDQSGLSTLEYTILFVIIVVGALTIWSKLGQPVP